MIFIFDLDDVLYNELTYVRSGFKVVSKYLSKHYSLSEKDIFNSMIAFLEQSRTRVFNKTLDQYGILTKVKVQQCLSIYRSHKPDIKLDKDAAFTINKLRNYPKYIVTDGNKLVQSNKIKALGLQKTIKYSYITHRYGLQHAKPSPYCFLKIIQSENISPKEAVYIGDNPQKDFIGIKPLGFKTIRLLQGPYKELKLDNRYEADFNINSLKEILDIFRDIK